MRNDLRSLPNIEYLGNVSPARAQEVIANAATLLCTSDQEGFPNTFLEAWSAGTPVTTLMIDPGCVIREKGLGLVSGTVDRAVTDIQKLMACPETFEALSQRARRYIEEEHSDAAVVRVFNKAVLGKA
jgi:glycosyltransferase involved in cell wall biosynthesis